VLAGCADKVASVKFWLRMAALRPLFLLLLLGTVSRAAPTTPGTPTAPAVHVAHPAAAVHEPHKSKSSRIRDLADTVAGSVILTKFAAMVQASNLGTFLSSRGPFTLFVPTNSAFSKLPPGMFEDLLLPENQTQLQRIVLFHLVNGKILDAKDLVATKSLISCEGNPLPLRTSKSRTQYVAKSKIIHADIKCANGIIHQIDTMLMPPQVVLISKLPDAVQLPPPATNAPAAGDADQAPFHQRRLVQAV
jgi:uncharacterized surface protein with fasciclin (FAS1) repeats